MGFNPHWINLIQECINTLSFQLLINGTQSETFNPQRGLRKSDPLSPYIFLICQNVPSLLFWRLKLIRKLMESRPAEIARLLAISYLQTIALFFFRTNVRACRTIKKILKEFCISGPINLICLWS